MCASVGFYWDSLHKWQTAMDAHHVLLKMQFFHRFTAKNYSNVPFNIVPGGSFERILIILAVMLKDYLTDALELDWLPFICFSNFPNSKMLLIDAFAL